MVGVDVVGGCGPAVAGSGVFALGGGFLAAVCSIVICLSI